MRVKVNDNTQVAHDDTLYRGGETFEAPDAVAQDWLNAGYVTEAKSEAKTESEAKTTAKKTAKKTNRR